MQIVKKLMGKDKEDTMDENQNRQETTVSRAFCYKDGRLYFSRQVERRIFFGGTLIMLLWGILEKVGVL